MLATYVLFEERPAQWLVLAEDTLLHQLLIKRDVMQLIAITEGAINIQQDCFKCGPCWQLQPSCTCTARAGAFTLFLLLLCACMRRCAFERLFCLLLHCASGSAMACAVAHQASLCCACTQRLASTTRHASAVASLSKVAQVDGQACRRKTQRCTLS